MEPLSSCYEKCHTPKWFLEDCHTLGNYMHIWDGEVKCESDSCGNLTPLTPSSGSSVFIQILRYTHPLHVHWSLFGIHLINIHTLKQKDWHVVDWVVEENDFHIFAADVSFVSFTSTCVTKGSMHIFFLLFSKSYIRSSSYWENKCEEAGGMRICSTV